VVKRFRELRTKAQRYANHNFTDNTSHNDSEIDNLVTMELFEVEVSLEEKRIASLQ
jgi:hypothetical protein